MINESFLHFLWKYRLLNQPLVTDEGEEVKVENPGQHNFDSGPDFLGAKIRIGQTLWAGNVEIHIKSSDWLRHHHQNDRSYQNIILHVVHNNDKQLDLKAPTLVIGDRINKDLHSRYLNLINNKNWIPCEKSAADIDYFIWESWKERLMVEKFQQKAEEINTLLKKHKNSWEEAFYISLARNFGFRVNNTPFELLAKSLSLKYLAKHKGNLLQLEALIFGQAGLLSNQDFNDAYPVVLQKEYQHLKQKFALTPIDPKLWRFLRLRPANFPHIRLAQFAQLVYKSVALFSYIIETEEIQDIKNLLIVKASKYWDEHYRFDKASTKKPKYLGETALNLLVINTIIPYIFVYGMLKNNNDIKERALKFMSSLPPESNKIIKKFSSMGLDITSALQSQSLIYLKKHYCTPKKCLHCPVGKKILT